MPVFSTLPARYFGTRPYPVRIDHFFEPVHMQDTRIRRVRDDHPKNMAASVPNPYDLLAAVSCIILFFSSVASLVACVILAPSSRSWRVRVETVASSESDFVFRVQSGRFSPTVYELGLYPVTTCHSRP